MDNRNDEINFESDLDLLIEQEAFDLEPVAEEAVETAPVEAEPAAEEPVEQEKPRRKLPKFEMPKAKSKPKREKRERPKFESEMQEKPQILHKKNFSTDCGQMCAPHTQTGELQLLLHNFMHFGKQYLRTQI